MTHGRAQRHRPQAGGGIEEMFREADGKAPPELMAISARYGITIFPPG